jgi:hypothetical protein
MFLAFWLLMIFSFCVYGFMATFEMPGESFCRGMYAVLTGMSGLCVVQVIEPIRQRAGDQEVERS